MSLINPYITTELQTRVSLMPHQLNNDRYINLKQNLIKNVENKCNKYGFITKVYKILNHNEGVIEPENLMAAVIYDVSYSAQICLPVEGTQIICQIDKINKMIITAKNGPIMAVIKTSDINEINFSIDNLDNVVHSSKKKLETGDYIKITIRRKRFHAGDEQIYVIGFLDDITTEKEVETCYYQPKTEVDTEEKMRTEDIQTTEEKEEEVDVDAEDIQTNLENVKVGESNYIDI